MVHRPVCLVMLGGLALFGGEVFAQTPCDALANLQLPRTTITSATMVAAGPLSNAQRINVPAHCEVKGVTRPTKDSEIQIAVWLTSRRLEWKISSGWERWLGRRHWISGHGRSPGSRLCGRRNG